VCGDTLISACVGPASSSARSRPTQANGASWSVAALFAEDIAALVFPVCVWSTIAHH
jgi:hypothetical protein